MNFALMIVIKSTAVLICAALVSSLLRRASASTRHTIWAFAMLSALLLPVAASLLPPLEFAVLRESTVRVTLLPAASETAPVLRPAGSPAPAPGAAWYGIAVWSLGGAIVIIRLLLGTQAVRRLRKESLTGQGEGWAEMIAELRSELHLRKQVRLMFSGKAISPMTWGILRHVVLLPLSAAGWSDERRRSVLAHELAHVKRNDGIMQIFIHVVCAVYWFNPIVWYAAHRLRIERERACDDHALNAGAAPADYANHLLEIVRGSRRGREFSFAAVSMAQRSQLETRLLAILDSRVSRRKLSRPAAAGLMSAIALLTLSLAVVQVTAAVPLPPVVSRPPANPGAAAAAAEPAAKPVAHSKQRTRIGNGESVANGIITPPQVVTFTPAPYTNEARLARIEGAVTVEAAVDIQGNVRVLRVVKGLGYGLDENAVAVLRDWRFSPALRNGSPVAAITQIDIDFRLPAEPLEDGPIRVGPGVLPPKPINKVEPQYTDEARAARIKGTVVLESVISKDGSLKVSRVVVSLDPGLDKNAITALEQWKFDPGQKEGKAVDVRVNVEVNFNLK